MRPFTHERQPFDMIQLTALGIWHTPKESKWLLLLAKTWKKTLVTLGQLSLNFILWNVTSTPGFSFLISLWDICSYCSKAARNRDRETKESVSCLLSPINDKAVLEPLRKGQIWLLCALCFYRDFYPWQLLSCRKVPVQSLQTGSWRLLCSGAGTETKGTRPTDLPQCQCAWTPLPLSPWWHKGHFSGIRGELSVGNIAGLVMCSTQV